MVATLVAMCELLENRLKELWCTGLVAPRHVIPSWIGDQTRIPYWQAASSPLSHQGSLWRVVLKWIHLFVMFSAGWEKNSESENGPMNLDIETLIRAFGGKRAFYFYLYFLYPIQLGNSWKQNRGYLCHSICSFYTTHVHADPHHTHSKFISRTIIACLPESFITLPW